MPLSKPVAREALHHRSIECHGFRREDGLYDIEARIVDTKTYSFENSHRGEIKAGEAIHDMWLRLTLDDGFVIRRVEASTDKSPFEICPAITPAFAKLEGVTLGRGWGREVRQRLGGVNGCTHLVELLRPVATVAFQTIWAARRNVPGGEPPKTKPPYLDQCHALASDGEVVREQHPEWFTGKS
ncbi:MAG: DUF2889 domain-containing protein [Alphaproteobacteria bacterium]|jgi:hypothetical protein